MATLEQEMLEQHLENHVLYRYYFSDDINVENVNTLVEKLQAVEGKIRLYFSTDGGDPSSMNFLLNFLNSRKEYITVVVTDRCYSAGVDIFVLFEGRIEIEDLDCMLFHVMDRQRYSYRVDGYTSDPKILAKQDKEYNINFAKKIKKKGLLTDKQLKQFLNGRDVIVYKKQFEKWKLN